jgi:hypothetical protein
MSFAHALGFGALLGDGRNGWRTHDQRAGGNSGREASLQRVARAPALPRSCRRLLRMEAERETQAAVLL